MGIIMSQSKNTKIIQKISNLSLNIKMAIVVILGTLLFIIRNIISENEGGTTIK